MKAKQRFLLTNTMRSGSSLLVSFLSAHSEIVVLSDNVHFWRFMHQRYDPLNQKNVERMLRVESLRLKYRNGFELDVEGIQGSLQGNAMSYRDVYDAIKTSILEKTGKSVWGDAPALQWREIPMFLKFFPDGKVIHLCRDPRGVLASWKRTSSLPNNVYLNAIFNWIDSINFMERYTETLSPENYCPVKFEDVTQKPQELVEKLCRFIGVPFERELMEPNMWPGLIDDEYVKLPESAHEGKNIVGYSTQRAQYWKTKLEEWEIALIEFLAEDKLKKLGYELYKAQYALSDLRRGIDVLRGNPFLLKQLNVYLATGEGTNQYPTDPTDPKSWGAPNNMSGWFMDSPVAKEYFSDLDRVEEMLRKKYD